METNREIELVESSIVDKVIGRISNRAFIVQIHPDATEEQKAYANALSTFAVIFLRSGNPLAIPLALNLKQISDPYMPQKNEEI